MGRGDVARVARRMMVLRPAALAAIAALGAAGASADVYKCTGPQGQVTYSESPCPGQPSVRMDVRKPPDSRDPRPPDAAVAPPDAATKAAPTVAPVPAPPSAHELSYSERQRIANLEQIERMSTAYREQRQAATLEIANIRRGVLARMSADDLAKKDQYWADLSRLEAERRRVAASQLANLFAAYP
jgi:hypothetical protein